MYYAQITNGIVTAVTQTSGPVVAADMIEIPTLDVALLGKAYVNGEFIEDTQP